MQDGIVECRLAGVLAERLRQGRDGVTQRWLERIASRVSIDPTRIFPTEDLLDHVPLLVDGIADYLENPADEISADVPVIAKAMELGRLRQAQGFDAHEILKEYEILGGVLFSFLVGIVDSVDEECTRGELLACGQRLFRAVSVIQQVTAMEYLRRVHDEVAEKEERLRGFNRMVTHQLKNRIAAVAGASSMLREPWVERDSGKRHEFLGMIERNAEGMQQVLEDLLSLSRMEVDRRRQGNVMLPEVAAEAARQLRDMAREHQVEIRLAEDLPRVEVDSAAVELCLINYISNGIKYSDREKPDRWVEIRGHEQSSPDGRTEIVVEVRDNGIAVPAHARDHLFERFFRADTATDTEGTGLGLSIVRDTVESLDGRAWAEFPADQSGSIFKFAIPARRGADDALDPSGRPPGA